MYLGDWIVFFFIVMPCLFAWGFALVDIFRREDMHGWQKAIWLVAVLIFPLVGTLVYYIFRPRQLPGERRMSSITASTDPELRYGSSRADQLTELAQLQKDGKITAEQFAAEKERILSGT
jgi:hypothetical protein